MGMLVNPWQTYVKLRNEQGQQLILRLYYNESVYLLIIDGCVVFHLYQFI